MSLLHDAFARARSENRAALIAYLPAGYPTEDGAVECIAAMVEGGVDIVEIGFPYSDPVMDGPTIQDAVNISLEGGTKSATVINTVKRVADLGVPALVITPDLTPEEAEDWILATNSNDVDRVFLVALSSSDERIAKVANATTGFIYAGAVMGVTGARTSISDAIEGLVAKVRRHSDLPVAVGLGVSTPEQAHEIAQYADGVIVGSAFVTAIKKDGAAGAKALALALSKGLAR